MKRMNDTNQRKQQILQTAEAKQRPEIHTLRIVNPVTAKNSMRRIVMKSFFTRQQRKHFQNFRMEKFPR